MRRATSAFTRSKPLSQSCPSPCSVHVALLSLFLVRPAASPTQAASRPRRGAISAFQAIGAHLGLNDQSLAKRDASEPQWVRLILSARALACLDTTARQGARATCRASAVSLNSNLLRSRSFRAYRYTCRAQRAFTLLILSMPLLGSVAAIGRFNTQTGSPSFDSCTQSRPGTRVPAAGSHNFIACAPGAH